MLGKSRRPRAYVLSARGTVWTKCKPGLADSCRLDVREVDPVYQPKRPVTHAGTAQVQIPTSPNGFLVLGNTPACGKMPPLGSVLTSAKLKANIDGCSHPLISLQPSTSAGVRNGEKS